MCTIISLEEITILETWKRFYNGPNAGFINIEIARKEMPWLIGEGVSVTINTLDRD